MAAEIDRKILKLIDQIWNDKRAGRDRRAAPRYPFRVQQRFAAVGSGRLPGLDAFRSIACKDISLSGISFFCGWSPTFDEAVIELGVVPDVRYVRIKVVGCILSDLLLPEYVVRCRFNGHVTYQPADVTM